MGPAVAMNFDVGSTVRLRAGVWRKPHDARAGHRAVELPPHGVNALRDRPGVSATFHRRVVPAGVDAAVAVGHVLAIVGELASGLVKTQPCGCGRAADCWACCGAGEFAVATMSHRRTTTRSDARMTP